MPKELETSVQEAETAARGWLSAQSGNRKATINDIAALAQVSKKTVSRVINASPMVKEQTREVVSAIIDTLGYKPDPQARGLAFRHSFLVGMVYDNPNPQYVVNMQEGILDGLRGTGYELVVHPCERGGASNIDEVKAFASRLNLYSAILTPSISENDAMAQALEEQGCRCIRVASVALSAPDRMIVTQDREGGRAAAEHLVSLGHRRIAHLTGLKSFRSAFERRTGFEQGLSNAGLDLDPSLVFDGDYTFEAGIRCGEHLLGLADPPTAIFAANDEMAAGILHVYVRCGHAMPEALSIVGYDDFKVAQNTFPQLTSMRTPIREIGKHAAQLAIQGAEQTRAGPPPICPQLVVRGSSGPPTT